jgi:hypothetical protein
MVLPLACSFRFAGSSSGSNHREYQFELGDRIESVRFTGGYKNHLTAMQVVRVADDADFCLAFEHLQQRIERGRVFAQTLAFIEGEKRQASYGFFNDFAADDRAVLVVNVCKDLGELRSVLWDWVWLLAS